MIGCIWLNVDWLVTYNAKQLCCSQLQCIQRGNCIILLFNKSFTKRRADLSIKITPLTSILLLFYDYFPQWNIRTFHISTLTVLRTLHLLGIIFCSKRNVSVLKVFFCVTAISVPFEVFDFITERDSEKSSTSL